MVGAAPPAEAAPDAGLVRKVNAVMADSRVQRAKSSAVVLDAKTGERLYSRNGSMPRIPASNTKVLTAAAALETLGPTSRSTPTSTAETGWSAVCWTAGSI